MLPDRLSIIRDPLRADGPTAEITVSNTVLATPHALDLSPDGRTAYVVETYGPAPAGATLRSQLPLGSRLTVVDVRRPRAPRVLRQVDLGVARPETVSVSPDSRTLAISTATAGAEVLLVPVRRGRVGTPVATSLSSLGIAPDPSRPAGGMGASQVQWRPSGRVLALNLYARDQVQFARVGRGLRLSAWGAPVTVAPDPITGRFTPDGRHFLTTNWGRDLRPQADTVEERLPTRPGTVSAIRLGRWESTSCSSTSSQRASTPRAASAASKRTCATAPSPRRAAAEPGRAGA